MFDFLRPEFKKSVLQKDPLILLWQPRNKKDLIIEIQHSNHRWSDDMANALDHLAEELTLTSKNPVIPQMLSGGTPFAAMQTTMAFGGTCVEAHDEFLAAAMQFILDGKATVIRDPEKEAAELEAAAKAKTPEEEIEEGIKNTEDAKKEKEEIAGATTPAQIKCQECEDVFIVPDNWYDNKHTQTICPGCSHIADYPQKKQ